MSKDVPLIAVIDDEESVRKALTRLLQSADMAVETFSGGEEFLTSLTSHRPDCAVLDLQMPQMTGFEVLARLAETNTGVPVVIITGHDSPDVRERTLRAGAAVFLRKPINDRVLLEAIAAAIAKAPPPP